MDIVPSVLKVSGMMRKSVPVPGLFFCRLNERTEASDTGIDVASSVILRCPVLVHAGGIYRQQPRYVLEHTVEFYFTQAFIYI